MRRNGAFYLKNISGVSYIIPIGQMAADHMKSVMINAVGELIWNLMSEEISREEIIQKCIVYFEAEGDEKEIIISDVNAFLDQMIQNGMIAESMHPDLGLDLIKCIEIAGINVSFYGDKECLTDGFDAFEKKPDFENETFEKSGIRIEIVHRIVPMTLNGKTIVRNAPVNTVECEDRYLLDFSESREIMECHLKKDGSLARFYTYSKMSDSGKEILFHAIRTVFLFKALQSGIAAVHSVSIEYKNKAWLFSASSGTGKSTHADLWKKLFDADIINGDLNLIGIKEDKAVVYGLPWCGTSGIFSVKEYELGGIIFLKRNEANFIDEIPDAEKSFILQKRLISPIWDENMADIQFDLIGKISDKIILARLNCNMNDEAAIVMKDYIDSHL